ncbi:MAG: hypothetical protein AB8B88_01650, partial [Devosiaceae bacterium]
GAYLVAEAARQDTSSLTLDIDHPDARLIAQGAHPDAHWIDRFAGLDGKKPPKQIPVAAVRSTLQKLQSTAAYGGWRVLVVDSVEELNNEGANALLKPLEEPPHKTVILLVAHTLSRVLPTIRSRCRHLAFSPLDQVSMQSLAPETANSETLLDLAQGRPGILAELASDEAVIEAYTVFCDLAADAGRNKSETVSARLSFTAAVNALAPESRNLLLALQEDWLSRRVRGVAEPAPLQTPTSSLSPHDQYVLANMWSEQTAAIAVRQAINLDLSERTMALFARLDEVYSQAMHV